MAMTKRALDEMINADLSKLDLVALMIDGVHFAEHLCVVASGITIERTKSPSGFGTLDRERDDREGAPHRPSRPQSRLCAALSWW